MPRKEKNLDIHQIARLAGTSKSTVSRVFTNSLKVAESTRKRILEVAEKHNYHGNLFGRALGGGKTGLIGVILPSLTSGFYADVVQGINYVVQQKTMGHVLCGIACGGFSSCLFAIYYDFRAVRVFLVLQT